MRGSMRAAAIAALLGTAIALVVADPLASPGVRGRCAGTLVAPGFGFATCSGRSVLVRHRGSWREITPEGLTQAIHDVVFLDERRGWVGTNDCAGAKAFVYRTTDGGRAWARTPVWSTNCAAGSRLELSFLDGRRGWLARIYANAPGAQLARTTDGGATWRPVARELPIIGSVVFGSARDGWLGRADGRARPSPLPHT